MSTRRKFLELGGIAGAGLLCNSFEKADPTEQLKGAAPKSIVSLASTYSVKETMDRLEKMVIAKGIKVFARIDQQAEAEQAGLSLPPLELLIFGNPRAGTALMAAEPLVAIDLPLKAIAWQDKDGRVWLSYNKAEYILKRFSLSDTFAPNISVDPLMEGAVQPEK